MRLPAAVYRIGVSLLSFAILLSLMGDYSPEDRMNFSLSDVDISKGGEQENTDSLKEVNEWRRDQVQGLGTTWIFGFFGLRSLNICNSCHDQQNAQTVAYYWQFPGFSAPGLNASFFEEQGFYRDQQHSVRIAYDPNEKHAPVSILVPLSSGSYKLWRTIFLIVFSALGLYALYAGLSVIRVFENIALGKAFVQENSRILKRAAIVLLIIALWKPLGTLITFWLISSRAPVPLDYSFWFDIFNQRFLLVGALLLFTLSVAFQKGFALQQDHSLTV